MPWSLHALVQAVILGVLTGGVYALMASGQTLIFGIMKVVNLAQAAFVVLAAYLTYSLFTLAGIDPFLVFTAQFHGAEGQVGQDGVAVVGGRGRGAGCGGTGCVHHLDRVGRSGRAPVAHPLHRPRGAGRPTSGQV